MHEIYPHGTFVALFLIGIKGIRQIQGIHTKKERIMKTKLIILASACIAVLAIFGTAMADPYPLQFDPDASGATYSADTIWGWDLEAVAKERIPVANGTTIFGNGNNSLVDIVTHQQLGADSLLNNGDTFYEAVTVQVLDGLGAPPTYASITDSYKGFGNVVPSAKLYIDLSFSGHIENFLGIATTAATPLNIQSDSYTSIFDNGLATMYVDNNNDHTFNAGDTSLVQFSLTQSGPFVLVPSVFSGGAATIDYVFQTMPGSVNLNYFDNAPGYPGFLSSVNNGYHFTLTQGDVAVVGQFGGLTTPIPDEILIAFQETGFDAKFETVPEPSTIFLLGCGLIGVAAIGRKRYSKKG
jgi:hypothetical protein